MVLFAEYKSFDINLFEGFTCFKEIILDTMVLRFFVR